MPVPPRPAPFRLRFALLLAPLLLASACASANTPDSTSTAECGNLAPVYPVPSWQALPSPECAGYSSTALDSVRQRLATMPTTGFMAVAGGRVLMQYGDIQAISYLASVRKSVLSMLYGIYVDRGVIDLDQTLEQLGIDDVGGLTTAEKQATVRHLLMARSGVYHPASNDGDDLASAPPRGSQQPGAYYLYSNWDFNALGTIFEQKTGKNIYDALEEHLALPLGMEEWDRSTHRRTGNASKSIHLAYHMNFSTRDMARIGLLMLREGNWNGRQVVPREWVHESTRAHTPVHEMNPPQRRNGRFGYGYLWWVFDGDGTREEFQGAYVGLGAVGQQILVVPKLDLVIVHKTRPNQQNRSVSHSTFVEIANMVVNARRRSRARA